MKNRISAFLIALLCSVTAIAQNSIKVEVHNVVEADEQFSVTFIIEGDSPSDFSWDCPADFDLVWGPQKSSSSSISIINGKRTSSKQVSYSYILLPKSVGKFTIPAARATVKGNQVASIPVGLEVVASGASPQNYGGSSRNSNGSQGGSPNPGQGGNQNSGNQNSGDQPGNASSEDLFLRLSLDRSNVVVGQPITATLKLYQRGGDIAGFENADFPTFTGFWSQEIESPTNIEFTRENYDGRIYNSAVLRKYLLIPQQSGKLSIEPAELVCLLNVRTQSRSGSIFDSFFDNITTVRRRILSKAVTVNVSPLPSGAPASFGGGVGKFSISAKLTRDSLKMHEANSLIVTVTGTGNVSLLSAPKPQFPPDMEVYDTKVTDRSSKTSLSGSKQYEYPFIPRSYGDFTIEPVLYSYYDVESGKYVTLKTQPLTFHVEKAADVQGGGAVVQGVLQNDVRNLGSDIRFIVTKSPSLSPTGRFFVGSAGFIVTIVMITLLSVLCWLLFRRIARRRADIVGSRNRKATKKALKRLRLAGAYLSKNLYSAFYEELHKSLLGFISDKLNMPVAELNKENILARLLEGAVPQDIAEQFVGLVDDCEFARYSPSAGSDSMQAHYDKAAELISEIDAKMKTPKSKGTSAAVVAALLAMTVPFNTYALDTVAETRDIAGGAAEAAVQQGAVSDAGRAADYPEQLWNQGNTAYSEGRWDDAVSAYAMIAATGLESSKLYYNLGNAEYKAGNIGAAILNYERALKIDPSSDDARFNLEYVSALTQDRIEQLPEFILKTWTKKLCYLLDSDEWAVLFVLLFALTAAMVLLFLLAPSAGGKRGGFIAGIVCLILAGFTLGFSLYQKTEYSVRDEAIVMQPVISVKSSPSSESGTSLFILHEGTKVKVLDTVGDWSNIEIADGRQGWIKTSGAEII